MALKDLLTDLSSFYKDNPYQAKYKTKAGPVDALETPFDQRSLKFGNDRPGGGSSKQPFIQKPIPGVNSDPNAPFPDFLLRDPKNALNDRVDDLERIGKFLLTTEGLLFVAKQELLSLQNPIVPGRPNRATPISGLYNPLMTLAQVGAAGTGLHIEKQGLFPIFDPTQKYDYIYKNDHKDENTNRLTILYKSKINGFKDTTELATALTEGFKLGLVPTPASGFNSQAVMSYLGGPNVKLSGQTTMGFASNRVYGGNIETQTKKSLGYANTAVNLNTKINYTGSLGVSNKVSGSGYIQNFTTSNTGTNNISWLGQNSVYLLGPAESFPTMNPVNTVGTGTYTFTQQQLVARTPIGKAGNTSLGSIADFRQEIVKANKDIPTQLGLIAFDYQSNTVNREQRVGLGNPGKRTRNRSKLTAYDNETVDRINILPLYADRAVLDPVNLTRDLVKFRFEVINNADPGESTFIHFRAFLGAINDNFKADWSPIKYIGRGENFYNYTGFSRDISFSFKVHPQSRAEMKSIYQKLNYLASSMAPDYTNGYMKGNLVRLTIGDYLYIVPGFISNLTYNIPEDAPWEIALTEPEGGSDTGTMETPKLFDVNVSFTPIHDFVPQLGATRDTAFITNPTGKGATNPYLDDSKIYFFNNQTNPVSNPQNTQLYSDNMVKAKENKSTISQANLQQFATLGPKTITVPEAPSGPTNFTGNAPTGNAIPF
jgi:hypothetical protein